MKTKIYKPQTEKEEKAFKAMCDVGYSKEEVAYSMGLLRDSLILDAEELLIFKKRGEDRPELLCGDLKNFNSADNSKIFGMSYLYFKRIIFSSQWDTDTARVLYLLETMFIIEELTTAFTKKDMDIVADVIPYSHFARYYPIEKDENYNRIRSRALFAFNAIFYYILRYYFIIQNFCSAVGFDLAEDIAKAKYYGMATLDIEGKTYKEIRDDFYSVPKLTENMYLFTYASIKHYEELTGRDLNIPQLNFKDFVCTPALRKKVINEYIYKNQPIDTELFYKQAKVKKIRNGIQKLFKGWKFLDEQF